jgi:DNA invertase Pin-like site-specific DNA recombinase
MTIALLYCRVGDPQLGDDKEKLREQQRALIREAKRRGFEYKVIVEDGQGPDTRRDRLAEALDLLDEHRADVLMAVRFDGLGGDEEVSIARRSAARGWGLILAGDPLGAESASLRFQEHLDELEASRRRSQLTRDGIARRKKEGAVFGRTVSEAFLPTYRRILSMAEDDLSLNEIARRLNSEGVHTARGGAWHASTVRAILASDTAKRLA